MLEPRPGRRRRQGCDPLGDGNQASPEPCSSPNRYSPRVTRVLVIGAGGHARVCIEALCDAPGCEVVGCVSKTGEQLTSSDVDVVGSDEQLEELVRTLDVSHLFVAITNNRVRAEFIQRCLAIGMPLISAISRGAYISNSAVVGAGTLVAAGGIINTGARVGSGVIISPNASIGYDSIIGNNSHVASGVAIGGAVLIGDQALIGIGARIVPAVSIGASATVGAGSVVVRDVPARTVVMGSPARRVERARPRR